LGIVRILAWPAFQNKTGNPYTRLLYEAVERYDVTVEDFSLERALRGGYDLWHVHWPDDFLSYPSPVTAVTYVVAELLLMGLARLRGTRIVWTIHDLGPHESPHPWLESLFWPLFLPLIAGYVTLSNHAREAALEQFPTLRSVPGAVVPHGHYRPAYPDPMLQVEARAEWGLPADAPVAAYFGRIRPYKNVERLVGTFREVEAESAQLIVAGNPAEHTLASQIRDAVGTDHRIHLALEFIPDDCVPVVFGAADLVVLPYEHIMHSGSAVLALSFNRPVLVPERGAMGELRAEIGEEWVYTYEPPLKADDLRGALRGAIKEERPDRAPLETLEWDRLAEQTVALYERVLAE
jgi:glycosyltransferase involved in cell wall biosynthesis